MPQVSISISRSVPVWRQIRAAARTLTTFCRITWAKPISSSTVSPFMRSAVRNAAICALVAAPDMMASIAAAASIRVRSRRSTSARTASVMMGLVTRPPLLGRTGPACAGRPGSAAAWPGPRPRRAAGRSSGATSTPNPLIITTGTSGARSLTARATSQPVMPGIARSVKTTSNRSATSRSTASLPLRTVTAVCPAVAGYRPPRRPPPARRPPPGSAARSARRVPPRAAGPPPPPSPRPRREEQAEDRAVPFFALDRDPPAVALEDAVGHREAEAGALAAPWS